jgi:hypothetical protein
MLDLRHRDDDEVFFLRSIRIRHLLLFSRPSEARPYTSSYSPAPSIHIFPVLQVWSTHKRICGINSNPFTPPLFDDEEAKVVRPVLKEEAKDPESMQKTGCGALISKELEELFGKGGKEEDPVEVRFSSLTSLNQAEADFLPFRSISSRSSELLPGPFTSAAIKKKVPTSPEA